MKHLKLIYIIVILITILFSLSQNIFAQSGFECGFTGIGQYSPYVSLNDFWGLNKPIRTDLSGLTPEPPSSAYFPVLVVFVQFADDPDRPQWPANGAPDYLNNFISETKDYNTEWWNAYSETTEPLSDYWLEASRGKMHVLGKAYYVQLGNASNYSTEAIMNQAIWDDLIENQGLVNWTPYDLWKPVDTNGVRKFKWEPDGYVDMIYKIHKMRGRGPMPNTAGYAHLTSNRYDNTVIPVDPFNGVSIKYGFSTEGSGLTLDFTPNKNMNLSVAMHEHGHFLYADGHITYGKVVAGPGADGFLSPYEMILLGYMSPTTVTFGNFYTLPYNLKDYSARDTSSGYILKVPIATGEYFLITNRGNYSKWDKQMMGDTARINSFDVFNELGSGIYIHHVNKEISLPYLNEHVQDLECADGLWSFNYDTQVRMYAYDAGHCFNNGMWDVYKRNQVVYDNDLGMYNPGGVGADKSCGYYMWAWKGHAPQDPCQLGTERWYTTDEDYYAFDQLNGDRFDPWRMEYNEVFSPYSSPNTNTWTTNPNNQKSDIFIILRGQENDKSYNIDIYKVGENDMTEEDILQLTPPSRPMGLNVSVSECDNDRVYPVLTWNHNMEPDMIQGEKLEEKRYKVFRGYNQYGTVPEDYWEVADLLINKDEQPTYMDLDAWNSCMEGNNLMNSIRYKIVAIDSTNWASVYSDFVSFSSEDLIRGDNMGNLVNNNTVKKYELSQNYPNPFNPNTKINYALPKPGFVSLKIYDITGREIQTLVNEVKQEGYYTVDFNGSHLSSGVYFYRIRSGNFTSVKRMVLIK
ncbi:MAG: T9SS type A sorting domain-containing protein [Ignavibacteria bacterium]